MKDLRVGDLIYVEWNSNYFLITDISHFQEIISVSVFEIGDNHISGVSADGSSTFTDGEIVSRLTV